jgi:flagellar basal body-associated protein FliL
MELREKLSQMEKKSNKILLIELGVALAASIVVLIMHFAAG